MAGTDGMRLPAGAVNQLRAYAWPGNIRELRNLIERAHILAGDDNIGQEHILLNVTSKTGKDTDGPTIDGDLDLDNNARRMIRAALQRAGGNKSQAAEMLGITRRTLYSRLKLLGMEDETGD